MKKTVMLSSVIAILASVAMPTTAWSRDQIKIVGSSTVFPFATAVAERFGKGGSFKTPVVESTGTGGGMKLFCAGVGVSHPDMTNASRGMKKGEFDTCKQNGVTPVEVKIGFDGLVMARSIKAPELNLTRSQIFLALAKEIPGADGKLIPNPYKNWSDVDASLPQTKIEVMGPPPTSGTRDSFAELAMEEGCKQTKGTKEAGMDAKKCMTIREDGAYIEAGENDNLIVQKLEANPEAFGVFGYSFLDQNRGKVKAVKVESTEPTLENISSGKFPLARSIFFYVKKEHVGVIPGMKEYLAEFTAEKAWGEEGYLVDKGLVPLPKAEREKVKSDATSLTPHNM